MSRLCDYKSFRFVWCIHTERNLVCLLQNRIKTEYFFAHSTKKNELNSCIKAIIAEIYFPHKTNKKNKKSIIYWNERQYLSLPEFICHYQQFFLMSLPLIKWDIRLNGFTKFVFKISTCAIDTHSRSCLTSLHASKILMILIGTGHGIFIKNGFCDVQFVLVAWNILKLISLLKMLFRNFKYSKQNKKFKNQPKKCV